MGQTAWLDLWGLGWYNLFISFSFSLFSFNLYFLFHTYFSLLYAFLLILLFSSFSTHCSFSPFFFLCQPSDFFPHVIFPSPRETLRPVVSLNSTRAAGEASRNPLPPFPSHHWWSVSKSVPSTDHAGTHRDCLVMQTSMYEPLSCTRTRPHRSCLWIKLSHSLVGVCWQAAASRWLLAVRLVPFTAGVLCIVVFHNGGGGSLPAPLAICLGDVAAPNWTLLPCSHHCSQSSFSLFDCLTAAACLLSIIVALWKASKSSSLFHLLVKAKQSQAHHSPVN